MDVALAGYAQPSSSPVPPESPEAWSPASPRDTVRADALLDAAGWRRGVDGVRRRAGRSLDVELLTVGSGDNVVEQLVQGDLAARGVTLRVRQIEMGSFLTSARATDKQFDLLVAGIPGDLSLSYVIACFATAQRGGSLDYAGFHLPALDHALTAATSADEGTRVSRWREVQQLLDTLAPATWLYHSRGVQGVSRRVGHVRMDLRGELVAIHDWSLAAPPGR